MTCRDVIEFLADYLSGVLPAAQRVEFQAHLEQCPDCVAYLKSYEEAVKLGKAASAHPDDRVPTDMPEELVEAIRAVRRARR